MKHEPDETNCRVRRATDINAMVGTIPESTTMIELEGLVPPLAQALEKQGYEELTAVQLAVLSPQMRGVDALVSAQTGSGKTVAFGMAIAPTLLEDRVRFGPAESPVALIVAPTRELALQVRRELEWLFANTGAVISSCVGGMDIRTERRALERGVHIVVGTPGRLRDHITRNALDTTKMKAVVLDEADEMLDLGFKEDLEFILEATPADRRTLMFSATVPASIARLAKQYQRDAVRLETAGEQKQHGDIEYQALVTAPRERENAIINVLRYHEPENALIFCNTRATVNHMLARFNNRGFSVVALSGELSQNERTHALQAMRDGRAKVCIATDVAARGIDLPKLDLVIHADLPTNPETLLHRSGRTGRAGRKGISVLMVDVKGRARAERLLRFAKLTANWQAPPSADDVMRRDEERMLADPMLVDAVTEDEESYVAKLTDQFTSEQIAAAFLRLYRAGKSAPEDIVTVPVHQPNEKPFRDRPERGSKADWKEREPRKQREDFQESVWVSLSVGRKQNAEPRWLIPLICNAGNITKGEIGVIKMQNDETFVQLNAEHADGFFDTLGPNQTLEKNVRVNRLQGKPEFDNKPFAKPAKPDRPKTHRGKRERFAERESNSSPKQETLAKPRQKTSQNTEGYFDKPKPKKNKKPFDNKKTFDGKKPAGDFPGKSKDGFSENPKKKLDNANQTRSESKLPAEALAPFKPAKAKSGKPKKDWTRSDHVKAGWAKKKSASKTKPLRNAVDGKTPFKVKAAKPGKAKKPKAS